MKHKKAKRVQGNADDRSNISLNRDSRHPDTAAFQISQDRSLARISHGQQQLGPQSHQHHRHSVQRGAGPPPGGVPPSAPQRITITVPWHLHDSLLQRSDREGRSLSNLAAYLLEQACSRTGSPAP